MIRPERVTPATNPAGAVGGRSTTWIARARSTSGESTSRTPTSDVARAARTLGPHGPRQPARRPDARSASGWRRPRHRAPTAVPRGARPPAAAAAAGRPGRRQPLAAAGETDARGGAPRRPRRSTGPRWRSRGRRAPARPTRGADDPDLVAAGKRVGVTANSHKVDRQPARRGRSRRRATRPGSTCGSSRSGDEGQVLDDVARHAASTTNGDDPRSLDDGRADVAAGRRGSGRARIVAAGRRAVRRRGRADVARQRPRGRTRAAASCCSAIRSSSTSRSRARHPPGAERSALAHLLGRRRRPCRPTAACSSRRPGGCIPTSARSRRRRSTTARLEPEPDTGAQRLDAATVAVSTAPGCAASASPTIGNGQRVDRGGGRGRARSAAPIVEGGTTWVDERRPTPAGRPGTTSSSSRPTTPRSARSRRLLPPEARVGTVDKFQGQEAPVSIYSMATSSPEEAPRGMEFLYSLNRLNVATSRARCLAVVVARPTCCASAAGRPTQMRLANALCRYSEMATAITADQLRADAASGAVKPRELLTLGL